MPSLYLLLVLRVFSWQLILMPGEAAVYYVTPTEPPNPAACPQDQPCQTLDHYFSHKEEYFNSSKVNNVTMLLLDGEHVLSGNHAELVNLSWSISTIGNIDIEVYDHTIRDLETFEMIGLKPAEDVVIQLFASIILMNITKPHLANLTFNARV